MPRDHAHTHPDPASGDRRVALAIASYTALTVARFVGGLSRIQMACHTNFGNTKHGGYRSALCLLRGPLSGVLLRFTMGADFVSNGTWRRRKLVPAAAPGLVVRSIRK